MTDLIVKSGVQERLSDNHISADLYEALEQEVADLLEEAANRAEANDRKTVMAHDL